MKYHSRTCVYLAKHLSGRKNCIHIVKTNETCVLCPVLFLSKFKCSGDNLKSNIISKFSNFHIQVPTVSS
jgi:hypothetical protein